MSQAGTVLVVDDDKQFAEMIALALRSKGFEVRTARNGFHGYASYFRSPSDWVVTDIQMRELDGVEMMRCIRALNPAVNTMPEGQTGTTVGVPTTYMSARLMNIGRL